MANEWWGGPFRNVLFRAGKGREIMMKNPFLFDAFPPHLRLSKAIYADKAQFVVTND